VRPRGGGKKKAVNPFTTLPAAKQKRKTGKSCCDCRRGGGKDGGRGEEKRKNLPTTGIQRKKKCEKPRTKINQEGKNLRPDVPRCVGGKKGGFSAFARGRSLINRHDEVFLTKKKKRRFEVRPTQLSGGKKERKEKGKKTTLSFDFCVHNQRKRRGNPNLRLGGKEAGILRPFHFCKRKREKKTRKEETQRDF